MVQDIFLHITSVSPHFLYYIFAGKEIMYLAQNVFLFVAKAKFDPKGFFFPITQVRPCTGTLWSGLNSLSYNPSAMMST